MNTISMVESLEGKTQENCWEVIHPHEAQAHSTQHQAMVKKNKYHHSSCRKAGRLPLVLQDLLGYYNNFFAFKYFQQFLKAFTINFSIT